jgi:hypothetical protein
MCISYRVLLKCAYIYIYKKKKSRISKRNKTKNLAQYITKIDFYLLDYLDWLTIAVWKGKKTKGNHHLIFTDINTLYFVFIIRIKWKKKSPNAYDSDRSKWTMIRCKLAFTLSYSLNIVIRASRKQHTRVPPPSPLVITLQSNI